MSTLAFYSFTIVSYSHIGFCIFDELYIYLFDHYMDESHKHFIPLSI